MPVVVFQFLAKSPMMMMIVLASLMLAPAAGLVLYACDISIA